MLAVLVLLAAGCVRPAPDVGSTGGPTAEPPARTSEVPLAQRPHVHDLWGGEETLTLLEDDVQVMVAHNHAFDEPPREQHTHGCEETLASSSQGGSVKFTLPGDSLVLPGTETLAFSSTWSQPTITSLHLLVKPANEHDYEDAGAVQSGQVLRILVAANASDDGHATRSQWGFFLCASGQDPAELAQGDVHVRLDAWRARDLPLEPPHPDHWGLREHLDLAKAEWTGRAVSALNKGDGAWLRMAIEHGTIVPPQTGAVEVLVQVEATGHGAPLDPTDVLLYHRDALQPDWKYVRTSVSPQEGLWTFLLPVAEDATDSVYAHESNWDLWLRIGSKTRTTAPSGLGEWGAPHEFEGTVSAHAHALRSMAAA